MTPEEYHRDSIGLLESIDAYVENANQTLDMIADINMEMGATVQSLIRKSEPRKSQNTGVADKLISRIDRLIDKLEKKDGGGETAQSKIESKSIGEIGQSVSQFAKGFEESIPSFEKIEPLIPFITKNIAGLVVGIAEQMNEEQLEKAEKASGILSTISGSGIKQFAKDLATSIPYFAVARPFVPFIGKTIASLVSNITKSIDEGVDMEKAKTAADIVSTVSSSVMNLAKNLAIATPLMILATPGILLLRATTGSILTILDKFANDEKNVRTATSLINRVAFSMLAFSGAIAGSALILSSAGLGDLAKAGLAIALMGLSYLTFNAMGRNAKEVTKGSLVVLAMSGSVVLFALGMKTASEMMPDAMGVAGTLLGLSGAALVYGIAGKFFTQIGLGALAFAAIGLSMMILAEPYSKLSAAIAENPNALWQIPTLIVGLGTAYALAGIPPVPGAIALGAAAIATVGGSLWVLSKGLEPMLSLPIIDEKKADGIKLGIQSVVEGFAGAFRNVSLKEALTLPLKIPVIAGMGVAMMSLASGIESYQTKAAGWGKDDAETLHYTISSVAESMAIAGSPEGKQKVFGFRVGFSDMQRGVLTTMMMGQTLKSLASGVKEWKDMSLTESEVQLISDNINRMLEVIPLTFAKIGKREKGSKTGIDFLGVKVPNPFEKGDVSAGIASIKDMGDVLTSLSSGVEAWKDKSLSQEEVQNIANNVNRMLDVVPFVFADIGKREKGTRDTSFQLLGMTLPNPFAKGDVMVGIQSVKDMGSTLTDLATSIEVWSPTGEKGITEKKTKAITKNIAHFLASVPKAYADVGKLEDESAQKIFGFRIGKGNVAKGIQMVDRLLPSLKTISEISKTFTGQKKNIGLSGMVEGFNELDTASQNLYKSLSKLATLEDPMKALAMSMGEIANTKIEKSNNTSRYASPFYQQVRSPISFEEGLPKNPEKGVIERVIEKGGTEKPTVESNKEALDKMNQSMVAVVNLLQQNLKSQQMNSETLEMVLASLNSGIKIKDDI